jgi:hypothetical protein
LVTRKSRECMGEHFHFLMVNGCVDTCTVPTWWSGDFRESSHSLKTPQRCSYPSRRVSSQLVFRSSTSSPSHTPTKFLPPSLPCCSMAPTKFFLLQHRSHLFQEISTVLLSRADLRHARVINKFPITAGAGAGGCIFIYKVNNRILSRCNRLWIIDHHSLVGAEPITENHHVWN